MKEMRYYGLHGNEWLAERSGRFTPGKGPYMDANATVFLLFVLMVQKPPFGDLFNPVPISSSFFSVSTYLQCVLLLSKMELVAPFL
jgi:hypothetical protein